jgi:broad specificity phosphatase PhoE
LSHHFWLIRHALVDTAALAYLYGTDDVPVCDATMAADAPRYTALAARLPRPARLVCTPLSRTQLTAQAIFCAGYPAQTPMIDAAFVEQDFGDWQGMPISNFNARQVGDRHPFWPVHAAETPPNGESFDTMIARVGKGLGGLVADAPGKHTIIISHGGAIRAACAHALGLTAHQALCLSVDNISLTRLEHDKSDWRVLSINEHPSTLACETTPTPSIADTRNNLKEPQGATII